MILRAKNITARQFAEEIGIQPSGMSHIMGGRNNPSLDFVAKVLRRYPEIDANWLILGRGEMYSSGSALPQPPQSQQPGADLFTLADKGQDESRGRSEEPVQEEVYCLENELITEESPLSSSETLPPAHRRLTKLLFIYSDATFEECRPQR